MVLQFIIAPMTNKLITKSLSDDLEDWERYETTSRERTKLLKRLRRKAKKYVRVFRTNDCIFPYSIFHLKSNKYLFDGEAVLTVGDGVGTGKVFHYVNGKFNFHQRVYKMSNFSGINGKYFYYYFSTYFYDRVKRMTAKTSVDSVRMDMIAKMPIFIPTNEEQDKIINLLTNVENIFLKNENQLLLLQEYKKGLLQQMFI